MPQAQDLESMLKQQTTTLGRLLSLIDAETKALVERDADTLLQLAAEKQQVLEHVAKIDKSLAEHPHKQQLTQAPLSKQVADAKSLLAVCQQKNLANGKLIELCAASVNRLAQALQMSRNANSLTYDDKGKTSTISSLGNDLEA
ncbi:flagella synthesis protein FlgN [Shewanella dokdonensis]|uniref:flagella synthesis protein FlgN n=1 Tax=Shewanella dokdonensis TaxID=712036 RepID=UPI00200D22BF|nr:flagellar protein FlgN [Shewanella dokdonensis]MCL1073965.1 flagellar protein FlgN [Shewanella dokdonensis]